MDVLSLIAAISITASPARAHRLASLRTEHLEALGRVIILESHHEMETFYVFCFHKFIYLISAIRQKYMETVVYKWKYKMVYLIVLKWQQAAAIKYYPHCSALILLVSTLQSEDTIF